ncbi:Mov34-domain-containing protein [Dacryopinax primogenitus]|uniref:COP9 signalosome complex subunit 6 n=1 Tax=Dacryopinax primogenitus (strain DJM 731) TaxID=1858805 RepID=M5GAQ9_DACPD|nr:Mov34-domain-containing protein [Dacryopinax primogenitus]EJU01013.1 Mov34-domain-containing protein [Dacryopinax primogenitus]
MDRTPSLSTAGIPAIISTSSQSSLQLSVHPLPLLNISEHFTRTCLQTDTPSPLIVGALLGTQNGRDVEILNSFELVITGHNEAAILDREFTEVRREQYKQVFPSLDFLGWYTVSPYPTATHLAIHSQFGAYSESPLFLVLSPTAITSASEDVPLDAYEAAVEIVERKSRTVLVEVGWKIETGEAERISVDWVARGGGEGGGSLVSHLQTQRAAISMLHERILLLVRYLSGVLNGQAKKDHDAIRALSALVASLPASQHLEFREEFDTEYEDVQLTSYLATLTKTASTLNDLVDKFLIATANKESGREGGPGGSMHGGRGLGGVGRGRMGSGFAYPRPEDTWMRQTARVYD